MEWRNTGGIAHSVEFVGEALPEGTASSQSGVMAPGKTYSFTFNAPGSYAYICRFHVINGMIGKIIVVPDACLGDHGWYSLANPIHNFIPPRLDNVIPDKC